MRDNPQVILDDERLAWVKENAQKGNEPECGDVLDIIARLEAALARIKELEVQLDLAEYDAIHGSEELD